MEGSFRPDNIGWISNLRPGLYSDVITPMSKRDSGMANRKLKLNVDSDGEDNDNEKNLKTERDAINSENAMPPSFYFKDVENWKKKFDIAKKSRAQ